MQRIFPLFCLFIACNAHALDTSMPETINLIPASKIYEDQSDSLTVDQILSLEKNSQIFKPFEKAGRLAYSYTDSTIWLKVKIKNHTSRKVRRFIGSERPELTTFNMFLVENGNLKKTWLGGARLKGSVNKEYSRLHFFPIELAAHSEQTFYFQLNSKLSLSILLTSLSENAYGKINQIADMTHFLYFGTMFSLIIYTLFFYISLKNINFLIYSLFGLSILLADLLYSGFLEIWSFHLILFDSHKDAISLLAIGNLLSTIYTMTFFELKKNAKWQYRIGMALVIPQIIMVIISILYPFTLLKNTIQLMNPLIIIYSLSIGIYYWKKAIPQHPFMS